jgi:hypothetical protein
VTVPDNGPAPLVAIRPEDENFHPVAPGHDFTASETNYFGFSLPEHNINVEAYMWAHPRFGVAAGGVFIFQGVKSQPLLADYYNYFTYQPVPESLLDYALPAGLAVKIETPLERVRISYVDPEAATEFDVVMTGIAPPVGRPGGGHFTQSCRTSGRLKLRGRDYTVEGTFSRDHSWTHERPEVRRRIPPNTWMVGVFGDDLAFHTVGFDELALHPEWRSWEPGLPERMPFSWGYLVENGDVIQLRDLRNKITRRATDGVTPTGYSLDIVDVKGRTHRIEGVVKASCPFQWWPNMVTYMCQVEWRLNGRIGYGDAQDIQFNDWIVAHARG